MVKPHQEPNHSKTSDSGGAADAGRRMEKKARPPRLSNMSPRQLKRSPLWQRRSLKLARNSHHQIVNSQVFLYCKRRKRFAKSSSLAWSCITKGTETEGKGEFGTYHLRYQWLPIQTHHRPNLINNLFFISAFALLALLSCSLDLAPLPSYDKGVISHFTGNRKRRMGGGLNYSLSRQR